jgi:hypothetical protein
MFFTSSCDDDYDNNSFSSFINGLAKSRGQQQESSERAEEKRREEKRRGTRNTKI